MRPKAKEQQGTRTDIRQKSDKSIKPIDTKKEVSKQIGTSHDTLHRAKVIQEKKPESSIMRDMRPLRIYRYGVGGYVSLS